MEVDEEVSVVQSDLSENDINILFKTSLNSLTADKETMELFQEEDSDRVAASMAVIAE